MSKLFQKYFFHLLLKLWSCLRSANLKKTRTYVNFSNLKIMVSIFLFSYNDPFLEVMKLSLRICFNKAYFWYLLKYSGFFWQNQIYIIHASSKLCHLLKAPTTPTSVTTLSKTCRTFNGNWTFLDLIKYAQLQHSRVVQQGFFGFLVHSIRLLPVVVMTCSFLMTIRI